MLKKSFYAYSFTLISRRSLRELSAGIWDLVCTLFLLKLLSEIFRITSGFDMGEQSRIEEGYSPTEVRCAMIVLDENFAGFHSLSPDDVVADRISFA